MVGFPIYYPGNGIPDRSLWRRDYCAIETLGGEVPWYVVAFVGAFIRKRFCHSSSFVPSIKRRIVAGFFVCVANEQAKKERNSRLSPWI